jgi:2-succinyl-5-enolpyruvyl-6-hydroxy-3-cyclohexene-1-carboxylate synthase
VIVAGLVVDELARCGMHDAVLAPGSRNSPLAVALAQADRSGRVRLHVRVDERSAGFLAVGLAKGSGRPVAVCCTSGTATANLHPAVLEASESGIPLVVLTADRPPELRGVGANQTVDQARLYGPAVRAYTELGDVIGNVIGGGVPAPDAYVRSTVDRLVAAAAGTLTADPGPVQLNLPLREPLMPAPDQPPVGTGRPGGVPWTAVTAGSAEAAPLARGPERTLLVVGDAPPALGARARAWAEAAGWPLVAEPSSGARGGPMAVPAASLLLGVPGVVEALRPERVLVVGRPTLTRSVLALLRRPDVDVEVRSASPRWPDPGRQACLVAIGLPPPPLGDERAPSAWAKRWLAAGRAGAAARDAVPSADGPLTGASVAREVAAVAGVLVVGSSLPVRDLDTTVDDLDGVAVFANRGVAGIDGTVSTALGVALATGDRAAYAMVGDLTFLHDSNGLVVGPAEPRPALCLVVVDNNGGGIFATLEQGLSTTDFERLVATPHGVDLETLCGASRTPYTKVETISGLRSALAPAAGIRVVHAPVTRHALAEDRTRLESAVTEAVRPLLS